LRKEWSSPDIFVDIRNKDTELGLSSGPDAGSLSINIICYRNLLRLMPILSGE